MNALLSALHRPIGVLASRRFLAAVLPTGILIAAGYGGNSGTPPVDTDLSAANARGDIDALRNLPYLGYSTEKADGENGVVLNDRDRRHPGANLVSHRDLCMAELFDNRGRIIRTWEQKPCHHWSNAELLPMGDLFVPGLDLRGLDLRGKKDGASEGRVGHMKARFLLRFDYRGEVVWKARIPVHHDIDLTPRGELVSLTMSLRQESDFDDTARIRDNSIAFISLDGELLDEVSLFDAFQADPGLSPLRKVEPLERRREIDLFHANSVQWIDRPKLARGHEIYGSSNVLVSIRHQDVVAVVDVDERRVVWMWGRGELQGPHDAVMLDDGNITIFDNGLTRKWTRILEIDPRTETIVWEFKAPKPRDFWSRSKGSAQRLPNGNTLITSSDNGEIFEITPEGEGVWHYMNPHMNEEGHRASIVRTKRYEQDFIAELERRHRISGRRSDNAAPPAGDEETG